MTPCALAILCAILSSFDPCFSGVGKAEPFGNLYESIPQYSLGSDNESSYTQKIKFWCKPSLLLIIALLADLNVTKIGKIWGAQVDCA